MKRLKNTQIILQLELNKGSVAVGNDIPFSVFFLAFIDQMINQVNNRHLNQ